MRNYQKRMLQDYINNEFESNEYNLAIQLLSENDVLIGAIDLFITDLFIHEECFDGVEKYFEITREVQHAD